MISNKNCIVRLSRYKNALIRFKSLGFVKIFSEYLADAVGVTSAQVRKDFSLFGIYGNKRGGYQIDSLLLKLNSILGKNQIQNVIIVGIGNLGSALIRYNSFEKEGIKIIAGFDIDPAKIKAKNPIQVLPIDEMTKFIQKNNVKIAIVCVPEIAAQSTFDILVKAGIKGILNFAPIELKSTSECIVNNVNLAIELENLIYYVNMINKSSS